ncbi:MAG: hypothetical protein IJ134_03985 [Bacilli bacterium]|nr:hypothetical protein [Bacilli bacterium]
MKYKNYLLGLLFIFMCFICVNGVSADDNKITQKICVYKIDGGAVSFEIKSNPDGSDKYKYISVLKSNAGSLFATDIANWDKEDDINSFSGREYLTSKNLCPKRFVTCKNNFNVKTSWFAFSKSDAQKIKNSNVCGTSNDISMYTRDDKAISAMDKIIKSVEVASDITDAAIEEFDKSSNEDKDDIEAVCGILTPNAQEFIYRILDWIKYLALVLTVALSILDFFKAMSSEEDDSFKKAASKLTKRIIVVVVLFLLPVLLEFVLKLVHIQGINSSDPMCMK